MPTDAAAFRRATARVLLRHARRRGRATAVQVLWGVDVDVSASETIVAARPTAQTRRRS